MNICVVTSSFPEYPADHRGYFVYQIVWRLAQRHQLHVIYPCKGDPEALNDPFARHTVPYPFKAPAMTEVRGLDFANSLRLYWDMRRKIKEVTQRYKTDLIHAYWAVPAGLAVVLARTRLPIVVTLGGSDLRIFGQHGLFKHLVAYALKKSNLIIAVSSDLVPIAARLGTSANRIVVLPDGVNTELFQPKSKSESRAKLGLPNNLLMLYAGNLYPLKRVDRLLKIAARLAPDFNFQLLICGDGPERVRLQKLAQELRLSKVSFLGRIPHEEMPLYLSASDVLVLASESEALPSCVQEAMACGIPVVSNNVGGLPDLIKDGINGYLTSSDVEMEARLRLIMSSPDLTTMGAKALEFARCNLSLDRIVRRIDELYLQVTSRS